MRDEKKVIDCGRDTGDEHENNPANTAANRVRVLMSTAGNPGFFTAGNPRFFTGRDLGDEHRENHTPFADSRRNMP